MDFLSGVTQHPLAKEMIFNNHWLFAHLILAAILTRILAYVYKVYWGEHGKQQMTITAVTSIAILFELFQWLVLREPTSFLNAVGDIMAAFIMSIIIML